MLVGGELSGNDDFDCIGPVPLRDTLGGGAAIAIGSESYGEVHWSCPDPALATIDQDPIGSGQKVGDRSAQCVFTGSSTLFTIFLQGFKIS